MYLLFYFGCFFGNLVYFVIFGQVARDQDLESQIGKDIFFDLVDHEKVQSFRVQKQTPFVQFKVTFKFLFEPVG